MKFITRAIDRFCYKHPNFGIRNLMLYIIIGNAAVFLFSKMDTTNRFLYYLYFNPALVMQGQIWRLFTFVFIPTSSTVMWEVLALYFYYSLGSSLENFWGTSKFTLYYLLGIAATAIYGLLYSLLVSNSIYQYFMYFDATYLNLSLFLAFAAIAPDTYFMFFFVIPVKAKYLAIISLVPSIIALFTNPFPVNLLPIIALLNFIVFCGEFIWKSTGTFRRSHSKQANNFRRTVKKAEYNDMHRDYKHKCAVCGRTDTEYPNLEFRYCSRCSGYHCFCEDHINNHIHFTE